MKLMKHIMIALVLCAIPAMAFAQTVSCEDCTHDVSVYMGDGGLIAEADDADKVIWAATCAGVYHHGELEPDEDGMVMLQFMDRGIVCDAEEGHLQIGPVKDGGWFWITGDTNSAVGTLVNQGILGRPRTNIATAGPGVKMTSGRGAVLLKETATGRLGLLSTILPVPPTATPPCGYDRSGSTYTRRLTGCAMGDGDTLTLVTVTDAITGETVQIPDKGAVTRPAGAGTLALVVDLWMNGSGHFTTAANGNAKLGHPEFGMTAGRPGSDHLTGVDYGVEVGSGLTKQLLTAGGAAEGGVSFDVMGDAAEISIVKDDDYCSRTINVPLPVIIRPKMDDPLAAEQVSPPVSRSARDGAVGEGVSFTITCP